MKRSIVVWLGGLFLISLLVTACTPARTTRVRVATDATWPPFEYVDESTRQVVGFDIDLMNAIAEKENLDIEYINVSWDPLLAGMSSCQYDAAISAMTITEERRAQFLFTDPYLNAGQILAVRVDETRIDAPEDLDGMLVGAQMGTTGAIEMEAMEGVNLRPYDTVDLAYMDLANGQIDAVVADYPTAISFMETFEGRLRTTGEVFTDESYGIAVCRNNTELHEKLNRGLNAVMDEGLIPELEQKWLAGEE